MEPFSLEQIAILVFGLATFVYGAFVFAGNRRCFSVLAGGGVFLALHPSEAQYRTSARQSGVAVWLVALVIGCFALRPCAPQVCLGAGIVAALAIAVIIALQVKTHVELLRGSHE